MGDADDRLRVIAAAIEGEVVVPRGLARAVTVEKNGLA